jgi:AcrR family transcriptional regulator
MGRPRSTAARKKTIEAATEVVLELGIRGFSIDEVSRRSGVAKSTIYRHFPDRNELLIHAVDATVVYPDPPDTGTLRGDLIEFLQRAHPNFADPRANAAHQELFAAMARDPELRAANERVSGDRRSPLRELRRRWIDRGEIRPDLTVLDVFEIVDGPFVVRSMLDPSALVDVDYDKLVDRIMLQLVP